MICDADMLHPHHSPDMLHPHHSPDTPRRQLTRIYSRAHLCSQQATSDSCNARSTDLACYWGTLSSGRYGCRNREKDAWSWFQRHPYLEAPAPSWMLCPGSQASDMTRCSAFGTDSIKCGAAGGCGMSRGYCTSAVLAGMTKAEQGEW